MTDEPGTDERRRHGPQDEVERLCRRAVSAAGVNGGGVAVISGGASRGTLCATDAIAARIEEAQFVLGEGPCVDAATWHTPVLVDDLSDRREGVQDRWPGFLEATSSWGVRAVFAFPLRIGAIALGALDLYRLAPGPLTAAEVRAALLVSDALALAVLETSTRPAGDAAPSWEGAVSRAVVHNAAGMVSVQAGTTIEAALVLLRAAAYAEGRSLDDLADDVVNRRRRFPEGEA
jgi:hypothetical protein